LAAVGTGGSVRAARRNSHPGRLNVAFGTASYDQRRRPATRSTCGLRASGSTSVKPTTDSPAEMRVPGVPGGRRDQCDGLLRGRYRHSQFLIWISVLPRSRLTFLLREMLALLREMLEDSAERFWRDAEVRGEHPLRHLEGDLLDMFSQSPANAPIGMLAVSTLMLGRGVLTEEDPASSG
jgi:hypothetical protein